MLVLMVSGSFVALRAAGHFPDRLASAFVDPGSADDGRAAIIDLFRQTMDRWAFFGVGYGADAEYLNRGYRGISQCA